MNQFAPMSSQPISRLQLDVVDLRTCVEAAAGGYACNCPCSCTADEN